MKRYLFIFLSFTLFMGTYLTGCNKDPRPKNLIPGNKYVHLLAEFYLLKAYQTAYQDSAKTVHLRSKILDHYDVTFEQFNASRTYYLKTSKQHAFLKKALDELNAVRDTVWSVGEKSDSTKKFLHTHPKTKIKPDTQLSRKR